MHTSMTRTQRPRAPRLAAALLAALGLAAALAAAPADARAQAREMLNRLAQSSGGDGATGAFTLGRTQLDEGKYEQAIATFSNFIAAYPTHRNVDAAYYWLAYSFEKQNRLREAEDALARLVERFPKSEWAADANKLRIKVKSKLDPQGVNVPEGDTELKIIALQALCQNDRARCSSLVAETLRSSSSPRVKEAAILLLGHYGGAEAVPTLIQMARTEPDEKLRMRAISSLGRTGDERALDVLREIALSPVYEDESPTDSAIHALRDHESPRAVSLLGDVIVNGKNLTARQHAVSLLSGRPGEAVVDELFRIYDAVPDKEIRKYVVAGLGHRRSPRAAARLLEIARTAGDVELRKVAVQAIPNRGEEQDLDVLLPLYDSERDAELKDYILNAIGHYKHRRAYDKLMQVVRNGSEPLERRKQAISLLSRSKDPEVMRFLESMLSNR
ncbi:MAG TPA: HEAT repeat domain-containing protein [Pyrinomonadaceae bacterium]|nr:HEAT repeat domain-containing protein [Pyrinomonadaceae bacterium]